MQNTILNRGGLLLYYRQFKNGILFSWCLNSIYICCSGMLSALEHNDVHITFLSDEMDRYRIKNTGYIIDCPHCHLPIKAIAEEVNGNIFKVLL
jgi:hypothetical protein